MAGADVLSLVLVVLAGFVIAACLERARELDERSRR